MSTFTTVLRDFLIPFVLSGFERFMGYLVMVPQWVQKAGIGVTAYLEGSQIIPEGWVHHLLTLCLIPLLGTKLRCYCRVFEGGRQYLVVSIDMNEASTTVSKFKTMTMFDVK